MLGSVPSKWPASLSLMMAGWAIGLVEKKVLEPRWMRYSVRSAPAATPVTWPSRSMACVVGRVVWRVVWRVVGRVVGRVARA